MLVNKDGRTADESTCLAILNMEALYPPEICWRQFLIANHFDLERLGFEEPTMTLVKNALVNPDNVPEEDLKNLANYVCETAFLDPQFGYPMASLAVTIGDKDKRGVFTTALVHCCNEWFDEKESRLAYTRDLDDTDLGHTLKAFFDFLTKFYAHLKTSPRGVRLLTDESANDVGTDVGTSHTLLKPIADLLFQCYRHVTQTRDRDADVVLDLFHSEWKNFLASLKAIGNLLEEEKDSRWQLHGLFNQLRCILIHHKNLCSYESVRCILELIEMRATQWKLSKSAYRFYYGPLRRSHLGESSESD